jgi:hypothetical protein
LLALLDDPFADGGLRIQSLQVLRDAADDRLIPLLSRLVDQTELEQHPLLPIIEAELRRANVRL